MDASNAAGSNGCVYRRSRGVNWTEDETEQLLEAWSDRDVQMLLENGPHNRQAFERVSFHLAQRQMDKTPSQCREKIKKLKTIYRKLNSGQGKVSKKIRGRIVQKLHEVMGGLPVSVTMPSTTEKDSSVELIVPHSVEHPQQEVRLEAENNGGDGGGEDRHSHPRNASSLPDDFQTHFQPSLGPSSDFMADGSSGGTSDLSTDDDENGTAMVVEHRSTEEMSSAAHESKGNKASTSSKKSSRHRKSRGSRRRSTIYVLIDKIIASQAAANERFAALEERRLLLDKELEEKRLEAEARRQEAQRQHELRLLSTMAQQMACVLKSLNPVTFAGARCESVPPITVAVSSGNTSNDPSKSHEVVNGCGDYTNESAVYSSI